MKKNLNFLILLFFGVCSIFASSLLSGGVKIALIVVGVTLILLSVAVVFTKKESTPAVNEEYRYATKKSLMSEVERALYYRLLTYKIGEVFPQVSLVSIVDKLTAQSYRNELFRTVDFVVCDARTNKPVLVIELNDASHNRDDRKLRDEKVRCILERARLPLCTLTLDDMNLTDKDLRKKIISQLR